MGHAPALVAISDIVFLRVLAIKRRILCPAPGRVKLHRRMFSRTIEVEPRILERLCDRARIREASGHAS
jgi:hypothetical protein